MTPAWQAPDENSHFGYVQHLAEAGELPGDPQRPVFSSEQTLAASLSNADQAAAQPTVRMDWRSDAEAVWRKQDSALGTKDRSDGGGPNPASSNPPLYYLVEAIPYLALSGGSIFDRLFAMRLMSVLWLPLVVLGTWLLAGELFRNDRRAQFIAAALPATLPMMGFVAGVVIPDTALIALWTMNLWLGIRLLRTANVPTGAAYGATLGVALAIKATSFALLPAAVLLVVILLRRRANYGHNPWRSLWASAGALLLTGAPWFVVSRLMGRAGAAQVEGVATGPLSVREFSSYIWQYYLPKLPFQTPYPTVAETLPAFDIWFKGSVGSFGWTEVQFADILYVALLLPAAIIGVSSIRAVTQKWSRDHLPSVAFLGMTCLGLVAGLHLSEYQLLEAGQSNFNQGRYLLPLIGIGGVISAAALRKKSSAIVGAFVGGLLLLTFASYGLMLERFYA